MIDVLSRAIEVMRQTTWPDTAAALHYEVAESFWDAGFFVEFEHRVPNRGDGRPGRIDLVVSLGKTRIAIELDCRRPRAKSIFKLRSFDGFRLIGLRGVEWVEQIAGIDCVIGMPVRQAMRDERKDKRTVNRRAA
jgi:hypothetical protein